MNCPNWERLLALRETGVEPAEWKEARQHLADCPTCRRVALARDPMLLFAGLRPLHLAPAELERMVDSVRLLVRSEGFRRQERVQWWSRGSAKTALRAAAVAGLALLSDGRFLPVGPQPGAAPTPQVFPAVEAVESSAARLYQLGDGQLDVVLIVDAGLDV